MTEKDFLLPDLGEGLEEAEIERWLVAEGDTVALNQPLVEVNTAKALVEIPSPFAGVIAKLHGAEGEVVFVGKPLVTFEIEGGDQPEERKPKRRPVLVGYGVEEEEPPAARTRPAAPRREGGPVAASPPVRRLAKDLGVDLAGVTGTGPEGRVTREDVERAAEEPGATPAAAAVDQERIPVRGTRRLVTSAHRHIAGALSSDEAKAGKLSPQVQEFLLGPPSRHPERSDLVCIRVRQGIEDHRPRNAEHGGGTADAKGERQHGEQGVHRARPQSARGVVCVSEPGP